MDELMDGQGSISMAASFVPHHDHHHHHYDKNVSRRSVDWRDSGIVIDADQQFNSIDAICGADFNAATASSSAANSSSQITTTTNCCPWERIAYDQDDDGDTILHLAVVGCTLDKVRDLIKICDLDAINNMMQTPLHVATMANRPEMVQLLIDSSAKLTVHDRRGFTPLHLACQKGFKEIAIIILNAIESGSTSDALTLRQHLETTNFDGQTCLHLAASNNQRDVIELLVNKYDANLNCQDSRSGDTIMHKAVGQFNVDLVAFILGLDKHCNQADYSGRRPLDTIRKLRESMLDRSQAERLALIDGLIKDRIRICIEQNGCCALSGQQPIHEILDSASSSSSSTDYSDSDSDMN